MAEERKHLMRPSATESGVATGIADPRDRKLKPKPLSVRRDVTSHETDSVDSLVGSVDTMDDGADAFDVFELPIDTDVKGDVLTKTSFMSESNSSAPGNRKFPVIKRKSNHESVSADVGHSGNGKAPQDTVSETDNRDSKAWPGKPNLKRHSTPTAPEVDPPDSSDHAARSHRELNSKSSETDSADKLAAGKFGIEARSFNNNVWGRKTRGLSTDSEQQSPSKSSAPGQYRRDKSSKAGIQSGGDGRIFGTRTEARRERKERGLAAAASSLLTTGDESGLGSSMSFLNDLIADYSVVGVDDHSQRNDTYRRIPAELPKIWSSKLVDCELDDGRPHRVMFLWNAKGSELYIFDSSTKAISGPELRTTYRNWELDPVEFARFVNNNRTYPDKVTTQSKSWPFGRSRRT